MELNELDRFEDRAAFHADAYGNPQLDTRAKAIFNLGQDKRAMYCSKGYHGVQHIDLVTGSESALLNLGITNYQKRINQQGHKMFVDLTFPELNIKLEKVGEEFATGIRLINSYDGSTGVMVLARVTRLACSNGMVIKTFGQSSLIMKHNSNLVLELQAHIEKAITRIINNYPNLQHMVSDCMEDSVEWACVEQVMKGLIGRKKHIDAIRALLPEKTTELTRWDLYNAITAYATHGEQLMPNIEAWLQSKAEKVLHTSFEALPKIEVTTE